MAEAIVIVSPRMTCQQNIQRCERSAPGKIAALLQPLRMLRQHRIYDLRKGFVGRPHAMPPCQQVALEPSLTAMFTQYFHDTAIRTQFVIDRNSLGHKAPLCSFEDGV